MAWLPRSIVIASLTLFSRSVLPAADLIGSYVTLYNYFPNPRVLAAVPVSTIVGEGIEFPAGSLQSLNPVYYPALEASEDKGATFIVQQFHQASPDPSTFNGYVFSFDTSGPIIAGVELDPSSTIRIPTSDIGFEPHLVSLVESGITFQPGQFVRLNLTFAAAATPVPESSSIALLCCGLIALLWKSSQRPSGEMPTPHESDPPKVLPK